MDRALRDWSEAQLQRLETDYAGHVRWQPLAVEASHRRFYRIVWQAASGATQSRVVMASPPELENNTQFVILAAVFAASGIGVPTVLAEDAAAGWFLMTDLGDEHFADVYEREGPDAVLPSALRTVHRLQAIADPRIPPYTVERFADELDIYRSWFLGGLLDATPPPELQGVFEILIEATQSQPVCCVHRDFHGRNLLRSPAAATGVGVVDFQDALMGPATYDLASLLRDCYYRLPESAVARWRDAYVAETRLPIIRERFASDLDLTALQRQLKAVGIFARLHLRDGRDSHLEHIVPVLTRVRDLAAGYPALKVLAAHVDQVLPAARHRLDRAP